MIDYSQYEQHDVCQTCGGRGWINPDGDEGGPCPACHVAPVAEKLTLDFTIPPTLHFERIKQRMRNAGEL